MIFQKAQLYGINGIDVFLPVNSVKVLAQRDFISQVTHKVMVDIIFISHVEGLKDLAVRKADHAAFTVIQRKARLDRFAQPQAAGAHSLHLGARLLPERQRNKRRDIAAKAVHDFCPLDQRINLIAP